MLAFNKKPEDVSIRFVTNGAKSYRGFRASYTQLPCIGGVPSGHQQLTLQQQQQRHQYDGQHHYPIKNRTEPHQRTPSKTSPSGVSNYGSVPISVIDTSNDLNTSTNRIPCDRVIYESVFEVKSPYYPSYYPPNADCLYSIRRISPNICKLRLRFIDFDLKGDYKECTGDSLEVSASKICGRLPNNTIS